MFSDTQRIFISRKLSTDSPIFALLGHYECKIVDESLIQISQIRFSYTPQTDWIFFTSKNAIDHFFTQKPNVTPNVKYGVISIASALHLQKHKLKADFVGEGVNLLDIAKKFRDVIHNESVLFPQAIDSYQTIQKQLAFTNTCYNLYVYKTSLKESFEIPFSTILVFTSPSNVNAYFKKYKFDPKQKVIAIGSTTKHKLQEYNVSDISVPNSFDEKGLCACIDSVLSKL